MLFGKEHINGTDEATAVMLQTINLTSAPTATPSSSDGTGRPWCLFLGLATAVALLLGVMGYCLRRKCPIRRSGNSGESKTGAGPAPTNELDGRDQGAVREGVIEEISIIPWGTGGHLARPGRSASPEEEGPATLVNNSLQLL